MPENQGPQAYFSEALLKTALMTDAEEAKARARECPKCGDRLYLQSQGGGVMFSQCVGCGNIFVLASAARSHPDNLST